MGEVAEWSASLDATLKAFSAYFERLSKYQIEASIELSRMATDPTRAPEAYATYVPRLLQMQAEMHSAMQKIMSDTRLLFESMQRSVESQLPAPGSRALGAVVAPSMKYGQAGSQSPGGPGDWHFDPAQGVPLMDSSLGLPGSAALAPASTILSASPIPVMPMMPAFLPASWSAPTALPPNSTIDKDVLSAPAELQNSVLPPASPSPLAPRLGYTLPHTNATETSNIKYRCDGYRRVARAKP